MLNDVEKYQQQEKDLINTNTSTDWLTDWLNEWTHNNNKLDKEFCFLINFTSKKWNMWYDHYQHFGISQFWTKKKEKKNSKGF